MNRVRRTRSNFCCLLTISCFLLTAICSQLSALDFNFRPRGFVSIPMGRGNDSAGFKRFGTGGGGELGFEVDFLSLWPNALGLGYTAGLEAGMMINPLQSDTPENVSFYFIGPGLGLYFFPSSRLFTRLDAGLGVYQSARTTDDGSIKSDPGFYWRAGGEIGFRFTPTFTLAANTGWRQFQSILYSGMYAGLTAQLTFQSGGGKRNEGTGANLDQYIEVYPAFMQLYQNNAIGDIVIRNNENAEIRDLRLSFRAPGYTASEYPCGSVSLIPRGRSAVLPLFADFSPEILRFTDSGRVLGEVVIRYRFLGKEREAVRAVTVAVNNRNMVTEGDTAALAAFVSPTSPEALDYAKYIAGLARTNRRTGHNWNMQYAIWLLEGLRAGGIKLAETYAGENEVQYPAETLSYGTGSGRDLALLFAATLEGVGIPSALVKTDTDFMVAVSLDVNQSAAETMFNGTDKILVIDNNVWLPLSMNAFNEGFTAAWTQAAALLKESFKEGKDVDFVMVEEAWTVYPPAPLPELGGRIVRTDTQAAANGANRAMQQYIDQELQQILRQVQAQINANPTMALYNRLGIVQARIGRIAEAKAAYERAAGMGSVPAMTNRGNLALTEKDFAGAERWFKQALSRDSKNSVALWGLEKVESNK